MRSLCALSVGCSLCLESTSPRSLQGSTPHSFRSLLKWPPCRVVFLKHPSQRAAPITLCLLYGAYHPLAFYVLVDLSIFSYYIPSFVGIGTCFIQCFIHSTENNAWHLVDVQLILNKWMLTYRYLALNICWVTLLHDTCVIRGWSFSLWFPTWGS